MPDFDEESVFGARVKAPPVHEIGQNLDALSSAELAERIRLLMTEVERLETAIRARHATRAAADAAFKL